LVYLKVIQDCKENRGRKETKEILVLLGRRGTKVIKEIKVMLDHKDLKVILLIVK
jgi:hypothetical protein